MTTVRIHRASALLLALALPLTACQASSPSPSADAGAAAAAPADASAPDTFIGRAVEKGLAEARQELRTSNLSLNGGVHISKNGHGVWSDDGHDRDGLPKAEISPQGDLLIEGKAVALDASQRALMLDYRQRVIDIAEAGMQIGSQSADLAGKALKEGLANVFGGGDKASFEAKMDAEGKKIEAKARLLCDRMPALLAAQDKAAAAIPEFKPYARLDQSDVDDCMDEHDDDSDAARAQKRDEVRDAIRRTVRESVRGATRGSDAEGSA